MNKFTVGLGVIVILCQIQNPHRVKLAIVDQSMKECSDAWVWITKTSTWWLSVDEFFKFYIY